MYDSHDPQNQSMCNRRSITEAITGPATDALERSLKRPRTEKSKQVPSAHDTSFCFPDLYSNLVASVDGIDDAFPSISWNSDDDNDTDDASFPVNEYLLQPMAQSLLTCTKEESSSMRRSKSFRTNLADMSERPPAFKPLLMCESNLRPIRIQEENEETTEILTKTTTASPLLSREGELHTLAQLLLSNTQQYDRLQNRWERDELIKS